jgi:hypothetical protein
VGSSISALVALPILGSGGCRSGKPALSVIAR